MHLAEIRRSFVGWKLIVLFVSFINYLTFGLKRKFSSVCKKCSDRRVSDKLFYPTFARTLPTSSKVSKFVMALLDRFNWKHITMIVGEQPSWRQIDEALRSLAQEHKVKVQSVNYVPRDYTMSKREFIKTTMTETYKKTRVYVFIGESTAVVDFCRHMYEKKMLQSGEYVIISVDDEIYSESIHYQYMLRPSEYQFKAENKVPESSIIEPFKWVLKVTPRPTTNEEFPEFKNRVKAWMGKSPVKLPDNPRILADTQVPIYAAYAYDAVMIYAKALTKVLEANQDPHNGSAIMTHILNHAHDSIQGYRVRIDENGDSEGNYTVLALVEDKTSPASKRMMPIGGFDYTGNSTLPEVKLDNKTFWLKDNFPLDVPRCGFQNEKCLPPDLAPDFKTMAICTVCGFIVVIAAIFVFRHYRYEHKLACLLWKIEMKDITIIPTDSDQMLANKSTVQICRSSIFGTVATENPSSDTAIYVRAYTKICFYKSTIVALRVVNKKTIDLTRSIRKELKQVRELRHENLVPFIGACVDPNNISIVTAYCARGSLEDVLQNEDLDLDNMFVASLVADLIKGMIYLHDSEILSHGNLKPSNCLVDSRWVLQITDYGLHEFKGTPENRVGCGQVYHKKLLWRAPELLRDPNAPPRGSQKGDVYSFGIILHEIINRSGPWGNIDYSKKEIIERVTYPAQYGGKYFRPPTSDLNCAEYITRCMQDCWLEEPDDRPDFRLIRFKLKEMQAGLKNNIFDNMIAIMEKYAYNLEGLVQERTHQLMEEKKKTEALLHRMLPKSVAEQLKRGEQVAPESFDAVTIYFSDIVGFTALSAESTPFQVVALLNNLYTCFDSIIGNYDVYKVETIGDAYMVVSGLPIRNGDQHAGQIARLALHLLLEIKNCDICHQPGELLKLRIGIHSGPCAAGVVGMKMPRYCLFGDTVNTASRMESSGEPLKIHVSEAFKDILDKVGGFQLEERGVIPIKGKGEMRTFWLTGMDSCSLEAPKKNREAWESKGSTLNGMTLPSHFPPLSVRKISTSLPRIVECHESSSDSADLMNEAATLLGDGGYEIGGGSSPSSSLPGSPNLSANRCLLSDFHVKVNVNGFHGRFRSNTVTSDKSSNYLSCSNVFHECRNNILKELRKNGNGFVNRYRSAPTIDLNNENFV